MGVGSQKSSSTQTSLTPEQRQNLYNTYLSDIVRMGAIEGTPGQMVTDKRGRKTVGAPTGLGLPQYEAPDAKTLSAGDYNALEKSIVASRTAPLDTAWDRARTSINQEAANRGVWDGGIPIQKMMDVYRTDFIPAYQQAGADAATQRYTLQSQENAQANNQNLTNAAMGYQSKMALPNYLKDIYASTNGTNSSSSSGGFQFSL